MFLIYNLSIIYLKVYSRFYLFKTEASGRSAASAVLGFLLFKTVLKSLNSAFF